MDEEELEKLSDKLWRTDRFVVIGALAFALFAVVLAGTFAYVWVTRA